MPVNGRTGEPPAKPGEVRGRPDVLAQANQFAIERHPAPLKDVGDLSHLGEVLRALAAVARAQGYRAAVVAQLCSAAIPLDLERPALARGHRTGVEQHRRNESRLLLALVHGQAA